MKIIDESNWSNRKQELPADYVRVVEDALTLLRVKELTAKKFARLAESDTGLLRAISEQNAPLPGSVDEVQELRRLGGKALVAALAAATDEPGRVSKKTKKSKTAKRSDADAGRDEESSDEELDPYWQAQLKEHQASELISFASDLVRDGNHNTVALIARAEADRDLLVRARAKGEEYAVRLASGAIESPVDQQLLAAARDWRRASELMSAAIMKFDDGAAAGSWHS